MTRISLSGGGWRIHHYEGEDWRWRDAHMPASRDVRHWIPASVPGSVTNDLLRAGQIPNPYAERNSLLIEWIPARTWVYRKTFTLDGVQQGKRATLRFEGVDYDAQFFLNGSLLGRHIGMYTPAVFDVTETLNYNGDNLLAVVVEPAPHEQPQVGRTSAVRTHKSRMTYWWDFCPRMIHLGIWDDVHLDFTGAARLENVFVRPVLSDDFTRADIHISGDVAGGEAMVETVLRFGGEVIASARTVAPLDVALTIENPQLWWPNGYGKQPLYEAEIRLFAPESPSRLLWERGQGGEGDAFDRKTVRFGIRKIEFIQNEGAEAGARPYTLVVNGRRMYIKGWNWVPMDVMYGVPRPEKLDHLLTLAQRAHVNLLRVWGGGLIEKEAFYDRCDELGILVWQEFILSSSGIDNNPSDDPAYIEMMTREAEQIVPRRRNHPSLAIWCGGNELQAGEEQPLDDAHPLLAALKAVVERLDPDRYWLPTSPTGRVFMNSLANIERDPAALHDVHGPWEYQGVTGQRTLYNAGTSLLHSEFGVEGITNLKSLNVTIAPEHQTPVSLDNPVWQHLGAWWVKEKMWRETFGDVRDVETLVRATQMMQSDGLRYALEADRRRKYQNSGTLPWQFNEPYPMAACTSAVDYYGQPKPAYYAVARAYAPLLVSARFETAAWAGRETFEAEIWVHNSTPQVFSGKLRFSLYGLAAAEWTADVNVAPDSAVPVGTVDIPLSDISSDVFFLTLDLREPVADWPVSWAHYTFTKAANLAPLLTVPPTTLEIVRDGGELRVANTGAHAAIFVWVEDARPIDTPGLVDPDFATFTENHFCLLPGESRAIGVQWRGTAWRGADEKRLTVRGWNTNEWKG